MANAYVVILNEKGKIHNYLCNMIKIELEKCHKKLKRR